MHEVGMAPGHGTTPKSLRSFIFQFSNFPF
jgi:hypothetical protein